MATATAPPPNLPPAPPVDGDSLYEVVNGRVVEKTPMGAYEGELASLLLEYLAPFIRTHQLGKVVVEVLFQLDPATNLQRRPDVAFVSCERWALDRQVPDEAAWDVVPDLAIEVVSRTNTAYEVVAKADEYFRAGVRCVWVVYPNISAVYLYESANMIRVLRLGDELGGASLLPGFRLPLTALFQGRPA
jgi:Uma2 family endonuclease